MWKPAVIVVCIAVFFFWPISVSEDYEECDPMSVTICAKVAQEWNIHVEQLIEKPKETINATGLYSRTKNCISKLNCRTALLLKLFLEERLSVLFHAIRENEECLRRFFTDTYMARFSNENSCLQDYGFLEDNLINRRAAYTEGKFCFLKHTKATCSNNAHEYFNINYEMFAHHISTKPDSNECKGLYHQLHRIRCSALGTELGNMMLDNRMLLANYSTVSFALELCRDVQNCSAEACLITDSTRKVIARECTRLQILLSPEYRLTLEN